MRPKDKQQRQTALYSFYGAIGVSIFLIGFWWLTSPNLATVAVQRRLSGMVATWRCSQGHAFQQKGSHPGVSCPVCGKPADVVAAYICPRHGLRSALIRYTRGADGRERVNEISFHRGVWRSIGLAIRCPDCGLRMSPYVPDPFATLARSTDRGR